VPEVVPGAISRGSRLHLRLCVDAGTTSRCGRDGSPATSRPHAVFGEPRLG
jgi:hypothetical protein